MRIAMLSIAVATALCAQDPGRGGFGPGGWAGVDQVKSYLTLTDAQVQSLQQLQQQQREATRATHEEIGTKMRALREAVAEGSTDASALGRQLLEIEALRKKIEQSLTTYRTQAAATLTADQKTKLAALDSAAKLQPTIGQATALGLLTPPSRPVGAFGSGHFGHGPMRGPGGPGAMFMRRAQ